MQKKWDKEQYLRIEIFKFGQKKRNQERRFSKGEKLEILKKSHRNKDPKKPRKGNIL